METSGNIQMAIDKWLFTQHLNGKHLPTLRFYIWSNPTISLGYHQNNYPESWENIVWQGKKLDLVKRPTGGRAVLHQGDLTYSVVTSGLSNSRILAYQKICEFLISGWEKLGISLSYGTAGRGYIHNPNCFGTATNADLVTQEGYKLIGSAQLRRNDVILQHGSMRLQPDEELFALVFGESISQSLNFPVDISIDDVTTALIEAARDRFHAEFHVQGFSDAEWQEILSFV
ncbi:lipoate--protein ligase family protein [Calothrix sp. PCC 6303]|uniref:lipoate--protein ligase family protein n=2 Tax=Calothrix sp. PCC 6303 TaxID=1170562 RepID=UPI0002A02B7D|nr:biotin/lipoate A/B protein ligase [Calothrix sp. PCC 6303]